VSILLRAEEGLTIAQLAHAWAPELPGAEGDTPRCEQELVRLLLQDTLNGRFDKAGPRRDGQRSGLRLIMPNNRPYFLKGDEAKGLISAGGNVPYLLTQILVMREAALDFACRRQLPPPSWWTDKTEASAVPAHPKAPHEPTTMRDDIQEGRLMLAELKVMGEKSLSHKYKVSRDTARKARQAVLSELSIDKNDIPTR
jgi:hypothetical protein